MIPDIHLKSFSLEDNEPSGDTFDFFFVRYEK
jgi:hypothetical protein